jgi:hypothetical protein
MIAPGLGIHFGRSWEKQFSRDGKEGKRFNAETQRAQRLQGKGNPCGTVRRLDFLWLFVDGICLIASWRTRGFSLLGD